MSRASLQNARESGSRMRPRGRPPQTLRTQEVKEEKEVKEVKEVKESADAGREEGRLCGRSRRAELRETRDSISSPRVPPRGPLVATRTHGAGAAPGPQRSAAAAEAREPGRRSAPGTRPRGAGPHRPGRVPASPGSQLPLLSSPAVTAGSLSLPRTG